jgi:hypothetical protein
VKSEKEWGPFAAIAPFEWQRKQPAVGPLSFKADYILSPAIIVQSHCALPEHVAGRVRMATTVSDPSTVHSYSTQVRARLRAICEGILATYLPQSDTTVTGVWSEDIIRRFTAVFELQRVNWHFQPSDEHIHNSWIARVVEELTTRAIFSDPLSETLLPEMELYLRLLALALRLYKVNGRSLHFTLYKRVYGGITALSDVFERKKSNLNEKERVEGCNVAFLIQHCQYLVISIGSSAPFSQEVCRRARAVSEATLSGFGGQYSDILPAAATVIARQRTRPTWHEKFVYLEDACWAVFARDIQMRDKDFTGVADIETVNAEADYVTSLLCEQLKDLLSCLPKKRGLMKAVAQGFRYGAGKVSETLMNSGPFEEHAEYFPQGILDLLYQLSFRIRTRSRSICFVGFVKAVRMVLDHKPECNVRLQLKATDLWNRIILLRDKDDIRYGEKADCEAIWKWILDRRDRIGAERYDFSAR